MPTRGISSWATLTDVSQFAWRWLKPLMRSGSNCSVGIAVPNARLLACAHSPLAVGIAAQPIERLTQQVLVEAELQRRLAGAEQVVGKAAAIGHVFPVDVVGRR